MVSGLIKWHPRIFGALSVLEKYRGGSYAAIVDESLIFSFISGLTTLVLHLSNCSEFRCSEEALVAMVSLDILNAVGDP